MTMFIIPYHNPSIITILYLFFVLKIVENIKLCSINEKISAFIETKDLKEIIDYLFIIAIIDYDFIQ